MPPEPLPCDSKDFVFSREKKHERGAPTSDSVGGSGFSSSSAPRWRDSSQGLRDFHSPSPRRPLSGQYKQGGGSSSGYHQLFPDGTGGHGCTPSRSEDDSFRACSGRYGSRNSSCKDGRGSFWRSPRDSGDPSRQHHESFTSAQRSVADPLTHASSQPLPLKDHDKIGGGVDDGSGTGHRYDRDREWDRDHSLGSIAWKPLKWTRSASFSSSSKLARSESDEGRLEVSLPTGKETPVRSPVTSPLPSEEGCPRKKPRLGWGQGLAKYEKEKVGGPEDVGMKNGSVQCSTSARTSHSDASPKLTCLAGSASPATPSSVACSSSQGMEDRPYIKASNNDVTSQFSESPVHVFQNCLEDFSVNMEHLEHNSLSNLSSLFADLLQPEDASFGDSNFTRQTAMNKLLLLKSDILKVLEKTECEIDLFENELKNLNCEPEKDDHCQNSSVLQADSVSNALEDRANVVSKISTTTSPLKVCVLPCATDSLVEEPFVRNDAVAESLVKVKEQDIDSPETVTSRFGKAELVDNVASDACTSKLEEYTTDLENRPSAVCGDGDGNGLNVSCSSSCRTGIDCSLTALIMASNRDSAKKASEVFNKALPVDLPRLDVWGSNHISTQRTDMHIKEKLAVLKYFLRFKERVLTLKYRAFNHLWKEDLRLLSIRKHRPKSQKRFELNCRTSQNGSQKHRSSIRSRFTLPAGNLTLVPTTEIIDFTCKLLSDAQIKFYRSNLKMPALILDERERRHSRFITNNGLIEDPHAIEKEKAMINPWTPEEKEMFLEMLATFGKDFTKIASFLNHKTTADCIEFYYKNHKSESFEKVKKSLDLRKQRRSLPTNTYLVGSGKKWKREMNADSLDLLGAASVIAANANGNGRVQQKFTGRPVFGAHHDFKMSRGSYGAFERASSVEIPGHERETSAAGVLASMCVTLSSEAMSSCITSSVEPMEKMNYMTMDHPLTSEVTQNIDEEETCSDEGCGELNSVDWTDEEKSILIRALGSYGRDFARISLCVGTRSREQCKIFFSKARKCLGLDAIHQEPGNEGGTTLSDANGGRSDTDDACVLEMDSTICSTQSCSKMDVDTQSVVNTSSEGFGHSGNITLQTDRGTFCEQNDVGPSIQERVGIKVEKLESFIIDKKSVKREEGPLSGLTQEEVADVALGCNGSVGLHEAADLIVDTEARKQGNALAVSACELGSTEGLGSDERLNSNVAAELQQEDTGRGFPDNELKPELKSQQFVVAETGLDSRKHMKTCHDANNSTRSRIIPPDYKANETAGRSGNNATLCPNVISPPNYQHQIPLDQVPCLQNKPQIISWKRKENSASLSVNILPDPSCIHNEDHHNAAVQATINFEEHGHKRHQSSMSGDFYQQYLLGNQSLTRVGQRAHMLRGYPLRLLNKKEMNGDADLICESSVLPQSLPKKNGNPQSNQFFVRDGNGEKSNGVVPSQLGSGLPFISKGNEQSDAQLRPCPWSTSSEVEEQSVRTGDVKLFGQILSPPSTLQKTSSSSHESDEKPPSPKSSNSFSSNLSNGRTDGTRFPSRPEGNCHLSLEGLPMRSYGFWDGNRIQTGFSSLPESAMILSKYPGALAGVSYHPTRDNSTSNGVLTEYQQVYMQPFSLDRKRDVLPDIQKRNGFETVSGFQQQGRVGMDRVGGGGGILVGGVCTGVSDPVEAIKMHYAGRAGVLCSEEELWRDIGRRL